VWIGTEALKTGLPPKGELVFKPGGAVVAEGFEAQDIQPTFLIFPTTGCWEVTGRIGEHRVTFVLSVVKIGDGPARVPEV
jgi:hypothetical protein